MKKILDFTVKENRRLNADNFLLVLHSIELPEIQAGQFVNVRVDHSPSTFLRRPISVHDVDKKQGLLYLLVKIAGKGTEKLSTLKPGAGGGGYLYMVAKDPQAAGCIRRILTEQAPNPRARFVEMTLSDKGLQVSRS